MCYHLAVGTLREKIKPLSENRKRYLLLRIAGLDTAMSMKLVGIARNTYNRWFHNKTFSDLHKQLSDLEHEHRIEAIQMLRRDNQLEAVLLEGKIVKKMKDEIEAGAYDLVRTNLAREVYSRLMGDLDVTPTTQILTWEQKIAQIFTTPRQQIVEGEIVEVIDDQPQEVISEQAESSQGQLEPESEQAPDDDEEEPQ